jgi:hypothetical protein
LLACRRAAGLTQEDLAGKSGMSVRGISDLERGRATAPQRRSAELLGEALGLTGAALAEFLHAARSARPRRAPAGAPAPLTGGGCTLPIDVADFTARHHELDGLRAVAGRATGDDPGPAQVVAISGHPGVGKTALAVHAGHLLAGGFPDARMYIDLRGMDELPVTAEAALGRLLRALGLPDERIPVEAEDRESLYRSLTHDRRVLVVLDNAANEAQVRPLLLAGDRCLTVITSRRMLAGLAAVTQVPLDVLPPQMAIALLRDIAGRDRVAAEPAAAREVARLCGGLPLALRIAGNRLVSRPSWTIGYLAGQLGDERRRLKVLEVGDLAMRPVFAMSYQQLSAEARATFRRLALVPGPDFGAGLAAVLTGTDPAHAQTTLDEVADASLIEPGAGPGRHRFHDLIRLFATECLNEEETAEQRRSAEGRMLTALTRAATRAGHHVGPVVGETAGAAPADGVLARFVTRADAERWLDTEFANWFGAVRRCAVLGRHGEVVRLAYAMHWYSDLRAERPEWSEFAQLALCAADEIGDPRHRAGQLNFLGWTAGCAGRWAVAVEHHREALRATRQAGHQQEEGWSLNYIGMALRMCDRSAEAIPLQRSAVEIFDDLGDPVGQFVARANLALALARVGSADLAIGYLDEALAVSAEIGYRPFYGSALGYIGRVLARLERWDEAVANYRAALPVLSDDLVAVSHLLRDMGLAELAAGRQDDAVTTLQDAFEVYTRLSDRRNQEKVLRILEWARSTTVSPG